ncbi:tail fiber domain-containing protein [Portibacter lacus]|uniref:Peptidase S74 domain-containing protein n=1 Tax=Portibacter lacus TaxID=1099794 RepID=A0AA37SML7_9BACT|nr:tail fiber domain-containing protein [Portibacter lacus]GLR16054.1 hypothetical protein GCM10007940_06690 [Portibacter lacus]
MCRNIFLGVILLFSIFKLGAQSVGIGIVNPDESAALHISSENKGILIPTMTTAEMDEIEFPADGLLIYNTTTLSFWYKRSFIGWKEVNPVYEDHLVDDDFDTAISVDSSGADTDVIKFRLSNKNINIRKNVSNFLSLEWEGNNENILIGKSAGSGINFGISNVYIGSKVASRNSSGSRNVIIGNFAGVSGWTNYNNVMVGDSAGHVNEGNYNTFIGRSSGIKNRSGLYNTFLGNQTGINNVNGDNNVFLGSRAGFSNATSGNVFIGTDSGNRNTTGKKNISIGTSAGYSNLTGYNNVMLGDSAGYQNTSYNNTYIGANAGKNSASGFGNTMVGSLAGEKNEEGIYNTALGLHASNKNQFGNRNTNIGAFAGEFNETGHSNVNVGYNAGVQNSGIGLNTNVGAYSGRFNTDGDKNVNIGYESGRDNLIGSTNTNLGYRSGMENHGSTNVFIGGNSGRDNNGGSDNVFIGYGSGFNTKGSRNILIGFEAGKNEQGSNKLIIDNSDTATPLIYGDFDSNVVELNVNDSDGVTGGFQIKSSNQTMLFDGNEIDVAEANLLMNMNVAHHIVTVQGGGNFGIGRTPSTNRLEVHGNASKSSAGDWLANSDARLKKNIHYLESQSMLQQLLLMKGVTYEWNDTRSDQDRPKGKQYGFIAQDLQQVWPENVSEDSEGYLQTAYGTYDHLYVESIKALNQKIINQENQLKHQEQLLQELKAEIADIKRNLE